MPNDLPCQRQVASCHVTKVCEGILLNLRHVVWHPPMITSDSKPIAMVVACDYAN